MSRQNYSPAISIQILHFVLHGIPLVITTEILIPLTAIRHHSITETSPLDAAIIG